VIRFQSYAHIHKEEFFVSKDLVTDSAFGWGMVHRPVTTYTGRNPAFYVTEWDEEYMVPINLYVHSMNMGEAGKTPNEKPVWSFDHDLIDTYGL